MSPTHYSAIPTSIAVELRNFLKICEDSLSLITRESHALGGQGDYQPFEFFQQRKNLLPNLETALMNLRNQRVAWLKCNLADRDGCEEVKSLFQTIQGVLMKIFLLDRENQQAMLRRGLMPAQYVPAAVAQKPNYVASIYQRHKPL
jgi:hypothetical protein